MPLTTPTITTGQLCRQYLAVKRQIDKRPLSSYFQVPTDLLYEHDQLRNAIIVRQQPRREVK